VLQQSRLLSHSCPLQEQGSGSRSVVKTLVGRWMLMVLRQRRERESERGEDDYVKEPMGHLGLA
jgi:hypothetical protein